MVEILLMMKRSTWRWETIKILNYDHFSRSKRAATSLCSFPSWKAKTRQNRPQQPQHRVRAQDWIQTQLQKQATSHVTAVNQVLKTQKTKKRKSLQSWFQTRQPRRWTGNWCCSSPLPVLLLLPYLSYHIRWGLASIYINIRVSQSWKTLGATYWKSETNTVLFNFPSSPYSISHHLSNVDLLPADHPPPFNIGARSQIKSDHSRDWVEVQPRSAKRGSFLWSQWTP